MMTQKNYRKNKCLKGLIFLLSINLICLSLNSQVGFTKAWEVDKTGHVDYIVDGDTFDLTTDERIRLADIDAPETGDPGSNEAKDFLTTLVFEKDIFIDVDDKLHLQFGFRLNRHIINFINRWLDYEFDHYFCIYFCINLFYDERSIGLRATRTR